MFSLRCRRARSLAKRSVATLLFTTLASAGLVAATASTANAAPAKVPIAAASVINNTESLATGVDAGCSLAALPLPHAHCHVGLQPGNTLWFAKLAAAKLAAHYTVAQVASVLAGAICYPLHLTLLLGLLCAGAVDFYFSNIFGTLQDAANVHRCFGFQTDISPVGTFYNVGPYAYGGGHWAHPVVLNNDFYAVWQRNDSCAVNMTDPVSRYHFSHHCNDNINDRLSWYPSRFRLNYDGTSCYDWFNILSKKNAATRR